MTTDCVRTPQSEQIWLDFGAAKHIVSLFWQGHLALARLGLISAPTRRQLTFGTGVSSHLKRSGRSAMAQAPLATPELKLEVVTTSEEILVRCIGKMTFTSTGALQTELRRLIPETKRLVLDLAEMTYLDSFGLGVLVGAHLSAKRQQRQLKLINMSPQALQLVQVTHLTYLLE